MKTKIKLVIILVSFVVGFTPAYADEILVTVTDDADEIIIDGKWSFELEWKHSSENMVSYDDGTTFAIRSAHDYDNLYFLIDFVSDNYSSANSDRALLCIDGKANKNEIPNYDDQCFIVTQSSNTPVILKGGSHLASTGYWKNIAKEPDLLAAGGISSTFDRYSKHPHTSYEFKIPIETISRSDVYGIFIQVFDANSEKFYSWPKDATNEKYPFIPTPNSWGEIISPDKSIPEFKDAILIMIPTIFAIIYLTKKFSIISNDK